MNTRRDFFAAGAAVGALAATPLAGAATTRSAAALPSQAEFEALVGQRLEVAGIGPMTLSAVRPLEKQDARLSQFVLVMDSQTAKTLPPAILDLHHPSTGTFSLRLQASGKHEDGYRYRAEIVTFA